MAILTLAVLNLARASTFTVDTTADSRDDLPGDGVCADALGHCSLRAAVMESNAWAGADTIVLDAGTYAFTISGSDDAAESGDLDIIDDLTIVGAGMGVTIVDAAGLDRVFQVRYSKDVLFQDLTITGGLLSSGWARDGAGILIDAASADVELLRVELTGNAIDVSSPYCTGGGISNPSSTLTITESQVTYNSVSYGCDWAWGGAIYSDGDLTVTDSLFVGNVNDSAYGYGGAISVPFSGSAVVSGTRFASNDGVLGGAIHAEVDLQVEDCVFDRNQGVYGGAIDLERTTATIRRSAFFGNAAYSLGGGLLSNESTTLVEDSTFSFNSTAYQGGAIAAWIGGNLELVHVSIVNNRGSTSMARPGLWVDSGSTVTVANSVLSGSHTSAGVLRADCTGDVTSLGGNLVSNPGVCNWTAGAGDILGSPGAPVAPRLVPVAGLDLPVQAWLPSAGSPLVDAGLDAWCTPQDQVGVTRPRDGDGDGVASCDIGAIERP